MSLTDRIVRRVQMAIGKALLNAVVDTGDIQLVKIEGQYGEVVDGVERIQNYGMSSNPPPDSGAVAVSIQGCRDHQVVIACDSGAHRVTSLPTGEVVIYSMYGQQILLKTDGSISITATAGVDVGTGSAPVANATAVQTLLSVISEAVAPGGVPVVTPTPGATCPIATALMAAIESSSDTIPSTNLRAD